MRSKVYITELETWARCHWEWRYKWVDRLRPDRASDRPVAPHLLIGRAVHWACAHQADPAVYLQEKHPARPDLSSLVTKARKLLDLIPRELLALNHPVAESEVSVGYSAAADDQWYPVDAKRADILVAGKPDLYGLVSPVEVRVVDFKTTDATGAKFLSKFEATTLFGTQLPFYAVLLADSLSTLAVSYQYILANTTQVLAQEPRLVDVAYMRNLMCTKAAAVGSSDDPSEGPYTCAWCDFRDVDEIRLTGGDWQSYLRDHFTTKRQREENENLTNMI